ncbi:hypothetical protein PENTCL1PPCAC_25197, partial [Pristionchus entomophagus]
PLWERARSREGWRLLQARALGVLPLPSLLSSCHRRPRWRPSLANRSNGASCAVHCLCHLPPCLYSRSYRNLPSILLLPLAIYHDAGLPDGSLSLPSAHYEHLRFQRGEIFHRYDSGRSTQLGTAQSSRYLPLWTESPGQPLLLPSDCHFLLLPRPLPPSPLHSHPRACCDGCSLETLLRTGAIDGCFDGMDVRPSEWIVHYERPETRPSQIRREGVEKEHLYQHGRRAGYYLLKR